MIPTAGEAANDFTTHSPKNFATLVPLLSLGAPKLGGLVYTGVQIYQYTKCTARDCYRSTNHLDQ